MANNNGLYTDFIIASTYINDLTESLDIALKNATDNGYYSNSTECTMYVDYIDDNEIADPDNYINLSMAELNKFNDMLKLLSKGADIHECMRLEMYER